MEDERLRDGSTDDERETERQLDQYYADKAAYESELPENAQGKSSAIPPSDPRATLVTDSDELLRRDRREREAGIRGNDSSAKRVINNPDENENAA